MNKSIKNHKQRDGFTLIEILVASAIFSMLIGTVIATYAAATRLQIKASAIKESSQTARFIVEAIARDIRLADNVSIDNDDPNNVTISLVQGDKTYDYEFIRNVSTGVGVIYYDDGTKTKITTDVINVTNFEIFDIYNGSDTQLPLYDIKITFQATYGQRVIEQNTDSFETEVSTRAYDKGYSGRITSSISNVASTIIDCK